MAVFLHGSCMNEQAGTMGLSEEELQKLDENAKKVILRSWLLSRLMQYGFEAYRSLSVEEVSQLLLHSESELDIYTSEEGKIHPAASALALQQEFAQSGKGKSILDVFTKIREPQEPEKFSQLYVEAQNTKDADYRIFLRSFLYVVRIVSGQFEGSLRTNHVHPYEKVYGIWIFPFAPVSYQGKVLQLKTILEEEDTRGSGKKVREDDVDFFEILFVFPGSVDEEELEKREPQTWNEKLVDLLEIVFADKIKAEKKPELLHSRHQVQIETKLEGDMANMTDYALMAKKLNEADALAAKNQLLEQDNVRIKRENKLLLMAYQLKNEGIYQKEQMIEKVKERMVLSEEDLMYLNTLFLS